MKKTILCAVASTVLLANTAFAAEKAKGINPWTECGIGAIIFDDNHAAAAISNIIWDLGTTAVSSKISSEESCDGVKARTAQFIQDNYNQVIEETSQGSGEHLAAMLDMLDVDSEQQAEVVTAIRSDISSKIAADQSTPEVYYNVVMANM
jgi:hypothetical protein